MYMQVIGEQLLIADDDRQVNWVGASKHIIEASLELEPSGARKRQRQG
jgi:hypothetical protein